jgi:hypothetical protein
LFSACATAGCDKILPIGRGDCASCAGSSGVIRHRCATAADKHRICDTKFQRYATVGYATGTASSSDIRTSASSTNDDRSRQYVTAAG